MVKCLRAKCSLLTEQEFQNLKILEIDGHEMKMVNYNGMEVHNSPHTSNITYGVRECEEESYLQLSRCLTKDLSWSEVNRLPMKKYPLCDKSAAIQ